MNNENESNRSWMNAVTFAEAGEWETARAMIPLPKKSTWAALLEQAFMAVAFAEEGLHEEARRLMGGSRQPPARIRSFLESIGLENARLSYCILHEGAAC